MDNINISRANESFKELNSSIVTAINRNQENIDLASHFKESVSEQYAKDNQHVFSKVATTKFPEALQVEGLDLQYNMGFLPAIEQVWLTTGTSLFIWNYVDNTEIFKYECNELIQNAELITFKNHNELAISTTNHVFLHGVQQAEKLKIISNTCVNTGGVIMSNFIITDNQRVFMQGNDGHLYELNVVTDIQGVSKSCKIICHTESLILRYASYFFKSVPKAAVKSMVVDNKQEFLYYLLTDSSIHSVDIQGSVYLPNERYMGTQLESLHLIPCTESTKVNLMAISNKGERLYFMCKDKKIELVYTRSAPPLPGSLLFNELTNQTCNLSFYNHGVFAAVLNKSKKAYLVMTNANSIQDKDGTPVLVEDVYNEFLDKKIWSLIENDKADKTHYFKQTFESPDTPARRFLALTDAGISQYIKLRPVDSLSEAVLSKTPSKILAFLNRYGPVETFAMSLVLACSTHQSPEIVQFLHDSHNKNEGVLLYFSKIVENIWNKDIMEKDEQQVQLISAREDLGKLNACIKGTDLNIKADIVDLILETAEAITFICFMYSSGWEKICEGLPSTSYSFGDLVTTDQGALLAKEMVFAAIKASGLSSATNNYNFVTNFLQQNCINFLGHNEIVYYRGMECLQSARNDSNNGTSLRLSLDYYKQIINTIPLDTIQKLSQDYCRLGYHIGAIELVYTKYKHEYSPDQELFNILFETIENAFNRQENYGKVVVEEALQFTNEVKYHHEIYKWLMSSHRKELLVILDTPLLVDFIQTKLEASESLACLHNYYDHRKEHRMAVDCLVNLATQVPDISLEHRVACLNKACNYLQQPTLVPKQVQEQLELKHMEAKIQLNIYNALIGTDYANDLATSLKPANTLLHEFAYTHSLYEEALCLMDLMEYYNWRFVKKAWKQIIKQNEEHVKSKIHELSRRLYPSMTSFPVFNIYNMLTTLHHKHSKDYSKKVLIEAGVPEEVIADAVALLSSRKK